MNLRPYLQFNRNISKKLTALLIQTPLKPNHVTSLALLCGALTGFFMFQGTRSGMIIGAFFLHLSYILDNSDGEISRQKSLQTRFGKWYDIGADLGVDTFLWLGLGWGLFSVSGQPQVLWVTFLCCLGSAFNAILVVWERIKKVSTSIHAKVSNNSERKNSSFFSILEFLSHNGDSILLVYLVCLIGSPWLLLASGCCFINGLWIMRLVANISALTSSLPLTESMKETQTR